MFQLCVNQLVLGIARQLILFQFVYQQITKTVLS